MPFEFQRAVWEEVAAGRSGLLHATTGAGKTYAVWFALLNRALAGEVGGGGLRLLWITPMRALSADTARALQAPLDELGLDWEVGVRTGDTDSAERTRQGKRLPEALVTTPESLTLLLTRADSPDLFAGLQLVVVDEWHELIGNKRGVQVQLALARLKRFAQSSASHSGAAARPEAGAGSGGTGNPGPAPGSDAQLPIWGLSATLGNSREAMHALLASHDGVLVEGRIDKEIVVDTLLPDDAGRFPWGGHLGIKMLEPVVREIAASGTTLVFTNTRSQAEIWYQAILEAKPKWAGLIALHHGSLDKAVRDWVEAGLKEGSLKAVVATSSLDLGVDFLPVERVLQVGSAKGIARLLQRAGRSGHAPGRVSRVTLVPTNSMELIEAAAAQKAAAARQVESRHAPAKPLDVLVQHLVTIALGTGFTEAELLAEVRATASYASLTDAEWHWCLDFVGRGGEALRAYPEYRRVLADEHGVYRVPDAQVARRHRMSVGTIVAESAMVVKYQNGSKVGTIEESFIARLRKGDVFTFGGKRLELVQVREMTAYVQPARSRSGAVPRWSGTKMPLSSELAEAVLAELEGAIATLDAGGRFAAPEMQRVRPLLEIQRRWSAIPTRDTLVLEAWQSREGRHLYVYPFAGRLAHLGIASLLAYRLGRLQPATFSIAVNDYGFELMTLADIPWTAAFRPDSGLLAEAGLLEDALASLNAGELAARRFREIARVSGLIFQGFPGQPKSTRQLQASSGLIYEVFRKYDAGNLLLGQAEREVLEQELDLGRLRAALARMRAQKKVLRSLSRPTPFAFPLLVERLREQLTTEKLADRIERMVAELERQAGAIASDG
ncbi:MAG: ligase-associated DNA damage response DEXH box helicase [Burkholderiaceae bacterium]|nr:ligase-associated DNA damage response DEXH box helicase [Burkholderiaceae bacterium]